MGYYTRYELEVSGDGVIIPAEFIEEAKKYGISVPDEMPHENAIADLAGYGTGFWGSEVKWYSHEQDVKSYSKIYPNLVFKVTGKGEESGDMWVKYFKNGKMQTCKAKVTYDPYDEAQLK